LTQVDCGSTPCEVNVRTCILVNRQRSATIDDLNCLPIMVVSDGSVDR